MFSAPSGIDLVDNALKIANKFNKTKKVMEGQINNLQKKLDDRDNNKEFKEKNDKLKFNEGSLWMSKHNYNFSWKML
jgi:hypothetical protein